MMGKAFQAVEVGKRFGLLKDDECAFTSSERAIGSLDNSAEQRPR
jgi:hypothetical protein